MRQTLRRGVTAWSKVHLPFSGVVYQVEEKSRAHRGLFFVRGRLSPGMKNNTVAELQEEVPTRQMRHVPHRPEHTWLFSTCHRGPPITN